MSELPVGARAPFTAHELRQFDDAASLALAVANAVVVHAERAIADHGRFVLALSGGTTPALLYDHLASAPFASRIDWTRTHVCWGDERCVPPNDARSNYRMARERLLDHVPIPASHVHRIRGEQPAADGARSYEAELRTLFETSHGPPRTGARERFDLVLLGLGADGHTASLFPGGDALLELERWVVAAEAPAAYAAASGAWRVTLTLPLINAAASVMVLAAGADKSHVLQQVLTQPPDTDALPAQRVSPTDGQMLWLVDRAAGARLG